MRRSPSDRVMVRFVNATTYRSSTDATKRRVESKRPVVPTNTAGLPESIMMIQGNPSPTRMSNMLDPKALDTAMSPRPWRATTIDEIMSGTEVPPAMMVSATIKGSMPSAPERMMPLSTSTQLRRAIRATEIENVRR